MIKIYGRRLKMPLSLLIESNRRYLRKTILIFSVVFFMFIFPSQSLANTGGGGIIDHDEFQDSLNGSRNFWQAKYPDLYAESGSWQSKSPQHLNFILPEMPGWDLFNKDAYINKVHTSIANERLNISIDSVFASMKHIQRATNFTMFQQAIEFTEPITDAVWSYIHDYWWELFFILGIAYVLVGLILRRFVWMLLRFLVLLLLSGLLFALFSTQLDMWSKTLTRVHNAIQEHSEYVLQLPMKNSIVATTGNYVTDIGNSMYELNVVQPFLVGQFGGPVSEQVANDYFSLSSYKDRGDFVNSRFQGTEEDINQLVKFRSTIARNMLITGHLERVTYWGLDVVSLLIEIALVFQIIPLMVDLMFSSLPTDQLLGQIRKRFSILAKLFLGKLGLAFIISVGSYVNVYLLIKATNPGAGTALSIDDAQYLVIISYLATIFYCWKLLAWIFAKRDAAIAKGIGGARKVMSKASSMVYKHKMMKQSKEQTQALKMKNRPRSKPREEPIQKTQQQSTRQQLENYRRPHSTSTNTHTRRPIRSRPAQRPLRRR